jgi:hypothetical protein
MTVNPGRDMQFVDRSRFPPPDEFRGDAARGERHELLTLFGESATRRSQLSPEPRFDFGEETLQALGMLFKSKCAFCESTGALHIHHFRPPAEAEPLEKSEFAHLYYAWLRTDWNNVYSACEVCATSALKQFPVRNGRRGALPELSELEHFTNENYGVWRWPHKDKPWLLDPCVTRSFLAHLAFDLDGGIQPLSRAGAETIATYRLDRNELNPARARAFDDYLYVLRDEASREAATTVFDFAALEYGGAWHLLMRRLTARIAQRLEIDLSLERPRLPASWQRILGTAVGKAAFDASLADVRGPIAKPVRSVVRRAPAMPRLASVRLENFKGLEVIELTIPEPISANAEAGRESEASALLVLGENAAGKSSLLEALALALCGSGIRQRLGKAPSSFVLNPDMMGRVGGAGPDAARVILDFHVGNQFTLSISEQFVESEPQSLPAVFAYGAFRQYATDTAQTRKFGKVGTLFKSTTILPNPEAWLLGLDEPQFAMVARALRRLFTIEGEFNVIVPDRANSRCMVITKVGTGEDAEEIRTPLSVVSSGFRSVLAMVCDIFEGLLRDKNVRERGFGEAEVIILIDEIEAHLHPRWKMQIMSAFRRVFPGATIIATTHDPLCLRGMHDGEVVVLSRARREDVNMTQVPILVETLVELPNVENLTVEQLLTSDFFSMFSTDSPDAERKLAELGTLLAKRAAGDRLSAHEESALNLLEREVIEAVPLGSTEIQRLVQAAVADYLQRRRDASAAQLVNLQLEARQRIVQALEGF